MELCPPAYVGEAAYRNKGDDVRELLEEVRDFIRYSISALPMGEKDLDRAENIFNKIDTALAAPEPDAMSTRHTSATVKTAVIADRKEAMHSPTMPISGAFLTIPQAADFLGLKATSLRNLCYRKQIPHFKPNGGRLLFDRAELEAYVRAGRVASNAELADRAE